MKSEDRTFFRNFLIVLAALVGIAIFVGVVAGIIMGSEADKNGLDPRAAAVIGERVAPVGNVAVGQPPAADTSAEEVAVAAGPRPADQIVNGVCAGCHAAGIAGAPKLGDQAAWGALWANGLEASVTNAINGKGGMPPRGGSDASDEEMHNAVAYMFKQAGFE